MTLSDALQVIKQDNWTVGQFDTGAWFITDYCHRFVHLNEALVIQFAQGILWRERLEIY